MRRDDRRWNARRLGAGSALALATWCLAATVAGAAVPKSPALRVEAPAIVWSSSELELRIRLERELAKSQIAVVVAIDGDYRGDFKPAVGGGAIRIPDLSLRPGRHQVFVKSGTYEASTSFRYVRPLTAALWAFGLVASAALAVLAKRATRRR